MRKNQKEAEEEEAVQRRVCAKLNLFIVFKRQQFKLWKNVRRNNEKHNNSHINCSK